MPELCSETWPGITRCPESFCVLLAWRFCFLLAIYLLPHWATLASTHPWFILLEVFLTGMGSVLSLCPVRVCPRGFSWLKLNRDEGLAQVFLCRWTSPRRAHRLYRCRCFCSLKQELFWRPLSPLATHRCGCARQAPVQWWGELESSWSKLCYFQSCQWTWKHLALS